MSNRQKDKRYEFVKLCAALTKQGLTFTRGLGYTLKMAPMDFNRMSSDFVRTPFVDSLSYEFLNQTCVLVRPNQWSDRHLNK